MLCSCTLLPYCKETKLGSRNQEASSSACKNTGVVLVTCHVWKCALTTAISAGVDISKAPGFLFITLDDSSVRVTKIISRIDVSQTRSLPFRFLLLFDSMNWPYYQNHVNQNESQNSLKLSFTNIEVFVQILLDLSLNRLS